MSDAPNEQPMVTAIGNDHIGRNMLPEIQKSYRIGFENNSGMNWHEIALFYDIAGIAGSIPMIAQGFFPPGSRFDFYLCPCFRLNRLAWAVFFFDINGVELSYPAEGTETLWTLEQLRQATGRQCGATFDVTLGS
jgi:hypothetical protein